PAVARSRWGKPYSRLRALPDVARTRFGCARTDPAYEPRSRRRPPRARWARLRGWSAHAAAFEVRLEEVLRAGRGHRGRGGDLQRQRRRGHDLREAVDLARTGTVHQPEPGASVRQRRSAAHGADLEPRQPDPRVQAALDPLSGPVGHR